MNQSVSNAKSFATVEDMRSAAGPFRRGDVAEVSGYAAAGDGGGGAFYFEGTVPGSATITNIVSLATPINDATDQTPIRISTASPHGLSTGNAVLIAKVAGNTAANGAWLVSVVDPTHFTLTDSTGNGPYEAGTGSVHRVAVTTSSAHGLLSGAMALIAGVGGATGANGRWFPVGYVSDTSFTIPCGPLPAYTGGGILGDVGVSVPSTAGTSRWIRRVDGSHYDARWFGAVGDGMTDDTAALSGTIKAAHAVRRTATLPAGKTYRISRELDMSTTDDVGLEGEATTGRSGLTTVIKAHNRGMRSVVAMRGNWGGQRLKGLRVDANRMATYGVFINGASRAQLEGVTVVKAVKHGYFLSSAWDAGTRRLNDNIVVKNCSAADCGTLYQTANLANDVSYPTRLRLVTVPGTVSTKAVSTEAGRRIIVTGVDTEFLSLGAEEGDFIRLGRRNPSVCEVLSVDSDTQITLQINTSHALAVTYTADDYAVAVGDGWHEQLFADNSRAYIEGGIWHANAGCAFRHLGFYGPVIVHPDIGYGGMYGMAIGTGNQSTGVQSTVLIGPYFEGQGSVHGCLRAEAAHGLSIINPLWSAASKTVILGFGAQNVHTFQDTTGVGHYGGTHRYTDIDWHEHTKRNDHPASGVTTGFVSAQTTVGRPSTAWKFLLPTMNHTGKLRVDLRATYETPNTTFAGGSKVVEIAYSWGRSTLTLGTLDDLTPPSQIDLTLPNPTFELVSIDNLKYLAVKLSSTSTPVGSQRTFWAGEATVIRAGTITRP